MGGQQSTINSKQKNDVAARQRRQKPAANLDVEDMAQDSASIALEHTLSQPGQAQPKDLLTLQRVVGNRAVQRLIQRKLIVGASNDAFEREADRVADLVMRMPTPPQEKSGGLQVEGASLQRQVPEEEIQARSLLQRQAESETGDATGGFEASSDLEGRLGASRGGGSPLPEDTRTFMESRFGADFSQVRVHTGAEAAQMNRELDAQAFTHGQDIYMGEGRYSPHTSEGQWLLAHELTHVVQQTGRRQPQRQAGDKAPRSVGASVDFGSGAQPPAQSLWGSARREESPNLFASAATDSKLQLATPGAVPQIQFFKTNIGKVDLESSGFSATIGAALKITKTATYLTLGSQDYQPRGRVKATGPKDEVGKLELGFLQTVYRSDRNFYYSPGAAAKAGTRLKESDTLSTLPVRDGDAGKTPWYGMETVKQFATAAESTKMTSMYDAPKSPNYWQKTDGGVTQNLVKTDGKDIFRSWLAVQHSVTKELKCMDYADWEVDYGTKVAVNAKNLAASTVSPTTGGAKIIGTGDGDGGKAPLTGDPVANDVAVIVPGNW